MAKGKPRFKRKILVLGTFSVGKTSLVNRFVSNRFSDIYIPTIGVSIKKRTIDIGEAELDMVIWDIADVATFDIIPEHYLTGAHGVAIVFDLSRPDTLMTSLDGVQKFREKLPDSSIIIIGNKSDLDEVGRSLNEAGFNEFHTSAKTGESVEDAFTALGRMTFSDR